MDTVGSLVTTISQSSHASDIEMHCKIDDNFNSFSTSMDEWEHQPKQEVSERYETAHVVAQSTHNVKSRRQQAAIVIAAIILLLSLVVIAIADVIQAATCRTRD